MIQAHDGSINMTHKMGRLLPFEGGRAHGQNSHCIYEPHNEFFA